MGLQSSKHHWSSPQRLPSPEAKHLAGRPRMVDLVWAIVYGKPCPMMNGHIKYTLYIFIYTNIHT